ncbi:MAG TPA: amino acid adenylation domain-containing protein, partial [Thermoanaerobaculia bacterium]|nr:amino acid adenylation domain-containing protein [Thermoanaerobaculia bacterium]
VFQDLLVQVREDTFLALAHQELPFGRLVAELQLERDLSHSAVFQVAFAVQNAAHAPLSVPDLAIAAKVIDNGTAKFDLTATLLQTAGGGLTSTFEYNRDLFDRPTIERLARHFAVLLAGIAAEPARPLSALPLLTAIERAQLFREWNDSAKDCPLTPLVHEHFAEHARRHPDTLAVTSRLARLTYGELDRSANRLAHHLRRRGVGPETLVAICADRTLDRVVGIVAVLKAGGAYVSLDPAYPSERLAFLIEDAGAPVLLAERRFASQLPRGQAELIFLDVDADWRKEGDPERPPAGGAGPENLAYVVYTSGSTGKPKGVEIPHAGLTNLVRWHQDLYQVKPQDRGTQIASPAFDASIWELWPYLAGGASLHIPDEEIRLSSEGMIRWWAEERITLAYLMTPLAEGVLEEKIPPGLELPVRALIIGGDRLHRGPDPEVGFRLMNHYGPAEYTVTSTVVPVPPLGEERGIPTIGRPVDNTAIYVLDPEGQPVPAGVHGELYVAGIGLARGYLRRPELTAAKFVPDPWSGEPGARMYRTADLVRYLPDGDLDFLGRLDHQVKVRGLRIELGEIESVLGQHPGVREAAVLAREAREDRPGDKRLAAYVTPAALPGPTAEELRGFLAERLPAYMVPADWVLLPELPLTANGKVDRRALPAPEVAGGEELYVPPQGPLEEALAAIWQEVLGRERIGAQDDFFAFGGHSLLATQVISRVRSSLGVDLPLRALFESPTVAALAAEVARARSAAEAVSPLPRSAPPPRPPRPAKPPLSFAQERFWFIDQLEPGSVQYNLSSALALDGALEPAALAWALGQVERRHEVLRTAIALAGDLPVQVIGAPREPFPLPLIDLAGLAQEERERQTERLAKAEALLPFDLSRGPIWRAVRLRLARQRHVLLFSLHHIAGDGWSIGVLVQELARLYAAAVSRRLDGLPELPLQYADFALQQRQQLSGAHLAEEVAWWREHLAGLPPLLELPTDRPRPPVQSFRGSSEPLELPAGLARPLLALAKEAGATPFMLFLAGWAVLLSRYAGQTDVAIGTPVAGRNRGELEGLIGCFLNTLVLRVDTAGNPSFRALLGRVRQGVLAAYAHQEVPFEMLVEALRPERTLSHEPLFQVVLNLQNLPASERSAPGLTLRPFPLRQETAAFDLILTLLEMPGEGFSGRLEHRTDLFDAATIRRMLGHLTTLFAGAVETPERSISELPLLTAAEQQELWAGWKARADFPVGACLHQLFEEQVRRAPEAPALRRAGERLSYGDLDRRANRLARRLRRLGRLRMKPEVVVGICLERSLELAVALLGVLKAGGAYLPLDPAYPEERLAYLIADAKAPVIVTERRLSTVLPQTGAILLHLDEDREWEEPEAAFTAAEIAEIGVGPENLAYVIYTSGSTGRPRGVEVTHGNVARLLSATEPWFGFGPSDVWTLFHSFAFDFSVWEIWGALAYGGSLAVVPYWVSRSPEAFRELLVQEGVTVLNQTPSAFRQLIRAEEEMGGSEELSLRLVIFGGEALEMQSLRPWVARHGADRPRLVNMYGITETTVHVTYRPLSQADVAGSAGSAIGKPIPDLSLRVLDAGFEPQPLGVPGELCVAGAGLARGYLGHPERTAARFVPDPWGEPGARLYRSGDLVRRLPGGDLEYLGRIDHQVKVRGFRIELGEIEAAIAALPGVREVAAIVREDEPGDRRLAAYVVMEPEAAAGALREALQRKLPEPLIPSAIVELAALPLTV